MPRADRVQDRQSRLSGRRGDAAQQRPQRPETRREARSTTPQRPETRPAPTTRPTQPTPRAKPADLGRNNVFSDRNGKVYRRTDQGWQQRERSNWSRPETNARPQSGFASQQPSLERDFNTRARGAERTQNFQRSSGGFGGRASGFGGGGRRR